MSPIDKVLDALEIKGSKAKRFGKKWKAQCPAHADTNPSLSIGEGHDGKALLHCHAGCEKAAIVSALGLEMSDLFANRGDKTYQHRPARRVSSSVTTSKETDGPSFATAKEAREAWEAELGAAVSMVFEYRSEHGEHVASMLRWDLPDREKRVLPIAIIDGSWRLKMPPEDRFLYHTPGADESQVAVVVEGEKCVDAAGSLGLSAWTNMGGSNAVAKSNWSALRDKDVWVLPDRDKGGEKHAKDVCAYALSAGARSVRVVHLCDEWPGLKKGGDLVDVVSLEIDPRKIVAAIERLAADAELIEPARPKPISASQPFPIDAIPEPLRSCAQQSAQAIGCSPVSVVLPLLSSSAASVGNSRRIGLKATWSEPAIFWGLIVGESGTHKSPPMDAAVKFLRERQDADACEHVEALKQHARDFELYKRDLKAWEKSSDASDPPSEPEPPVLARRVTADATIEATHRLLASSPRGLLLAPDEASGWFSSFGRYNGSKSAEMARWIELHGGRSVEVDRCGHGFLRIAKPALSICGTIQPGILSRVIGDEQTENGLLARFFLIAPRHTRRRWTNAVVSASVLKSTERMFAGLMDLALDFDSNGDPSPRVLPLDDEAQKIWREFFDEHGAEQAELTGAAAALWSKAEGYAARLGLVIHMVRVVTDDTGTVSPDSVDAESLRMAIRLTRWLGRETLRVYDMMYETAEETKLRELWELVQREGPRVSVRELMRLRPKLYPTSELARAALRKLFDAGLGAMMYRKGSRKGGRPSHGFLMYDGVTKDKTLGLDREEEGCVNPSEPAPSDEQDLDTEHGDK